MNSASTVQPALTPEVVRQERGRILAQRIRITRKSDGLYIVPASSGPGSYVVETDGRGERCSCPDYELHAIRCKHSWAVEYSRRSTTMADGSVKVTETATLRVTYRQDWPAYNAAQSHEQEHAQRLLHDLCAGLSEPPQTGKGERRLPISDRVFCVVSKVYGTLSTRRTSTAMRDFAARGLISKAPSYNAVIDYMDDAGLTPVLMAVLEESSRPLAAVETKFAVDSSGFSTCTYERWFDAKYGREQSKQKWLKAHIAVGVNTQIVTAAKITDSNINDAPVLPELVNATAERFTTEEVLGDKGYLSHANHAAIEAIGAHPYIAFKSNSTLTTKSHTPVPETWKRLLAFFLFQRSEFCQHYHQRSNVETAFSMIKRKFSGALRSKTRVAQENELLCKLICHNLAVLVHEMYELGIAPLFQAPVVAPRHLASAPAANDDALPMLDLDDLLPARRDATMPDGNEAS